MDKDHNDRVVSEFTRQSEPYSQSPELNDENALELLCSAAGVGESDTVLDVACGPGVVACYVARLARWVTGVDVTPAMLEQARRLQAEKEIANVDWQTSDVAALPFSDDAFSLVLSRYAFHHFEDALAVLNEMSRVCQHAGRIVIADVCLPDNDRIVLSFNRLETIRDPSHVHAFSASEFHSLFKRAGVKEVQTQRYRVEFELETLLAASSASKDEKDTIRTEVLDSLKQDRIGMSPIRRAGEVRVSYPISVFVLKIIGQQ